MQKLAAHDFETIECICQCMLPVLRIAKERVSLMELVLEMQCKSKSE